MSIEMSEQIESLSKALSKLQGEIRDVFKGKQGYSYNYADLSSVLEVSRPLLAKNGLSVVQMPGNSGDSVSVTTQLMHESGQWIRSTIIMPVEQGKGMSKAQAIGSVITYARRYSLAAALGITQSDDDAACTPAEPAVSGQQVEKIRELLAETKSDEAAFAGFMGVSSIEDLDVSGFNRALQALNSKIQKMRQQEG